MAECETCGCKLGRTAKTPIDRSLGFTAMLELYPGFRQMPDTEGMGITTAFLEDWYGSNHTDMWAYAGEWVADRLAREIAEHTSPPEPGTPGYEPVEPSPARQQMAADLRDGKITYEEAQQTIINEVLSEQQPSYGPNTDGNPYAQYTPEHRVWKLARHDGRAAAQWVFDGTTDQATFRRYIRGIADGDPAVLGGIREPSLNGEYGDDFTEDQLMAEVGWVPHDGTDLRDALSHQYNQEVSAAFWHEVEATALRQFEHAEASNITQLGSRFIECTCGERFSGGIDPQRIAERNFAHHLKTAREA